MREQTAEVSVDRRELSAKWTLAPGSVQFSWFREQRVVLPQNMGASSLRAPARARPFRHEQPEDASILNAATYDCGWGHDVKWKLKTD